MHRTNWLLLGAAFVAVSAFAVAGCGGGGGEQTTPAASTGGAPPAASTGGAAAQPPAGGEQVLKWALGAEPPSLDPGLATDTTSANIVLNIFDPLVRLGDDLQPVPEMAQSWDISPDGKTVTFHLRQDGKWTNGDPLTAKDFVYSWKRTISPELAADYAYQFYGIVGAEDYNGCDPKKADCKALAGKVGVEAPDDYTLVVHLTSAQPWFVQQVAHTSFNAVHQATVEQFGDKWTDPANIVTSGPFKLTKWKHDASLELQKWADWRGAADVHLDKVIAPIIVDGTTAVLAFENGEVDVLDTQIPVEDVPRLKTTPEWQHYPALGTYYYGFNVKNLTDVHERRALALAVDHQTIVTNVTHEDQIPAEGFTPDGMPGFDVINPKSQWLPAAGDLSAAKAEWAKAQNPKTKLNLFVNDSPGHKEIAVAIQSMWQPLGVKVTLKVQEWAQFLQFLGPPPNDAVDVYRLGWIGDYVDAYNFLSLWTCKSGNNNTNWCNKDFDALVKKAINTPDNDARYKIYAQLEQIMFGPNGDVPILPIYWYVYNNLEKTYVQKTFNINLLDQTDLTKVVVEAH
jgi:oligopeptide transport system substrate-binding protein